MKKMCVVLLVMFLVVSASLFASQPREGIGVGLITGLPFHIGLAAEYNFGVASAVGAVGYSSGALLVRLGGDYHFDVPFVKRDWDMNLYLSVGGHLDLFLFGAMNIIGVGIPVTWSYYWPDLPLKVVAKAGPEILLPGGLAFLGSLGAYYQL